MTQYAYIDPTAPPPVLAKFYDTEAVHYSVLPDAAHLVAMTPAQWANRMAAPYYADGTFVARPAPSSAQLVQNAVARLAAMLAQRQAAGVLFEPAGAAAPILFPTTPAAVQTNAMASVTGVAVAGDGTPVKISPADAAALLAKTNAYLAACVTTYAALHAAVADNPGTDLSVGWPSNA